jgi:hypothetical protein
VQLLVVAVVPASELERDHPVALERRELGMDLAVAGAPEMADPLLQQPAVS